MSALNKIMSRGFVPPQVHTVLDYPLAAILVAGPLVLDVDYKAATVSRSCSVAAPLSWRLRRLGRPGS